MWLIFRPGNTNWAHLSCALWIPEVRVGNVDKMEPITNVEAVPVSALPIPSHASAKLMH